MKLCLVSQEYPPETGGGGIGTQTFLKAQLLGARGHEVHVLSASWDQEQRTYRDRNAVIHRIPEPVLDIAGYEQVSYWLAYSCQVARYLADLESQHGFDIIQFPEYGGEGFVYQTDYFAHRAPRYSVQLHGPLAMFVERMGWPDPGSRLAEVGCFMEEQSILLSDVILASSHNTAAFVAERYGFDLGRIHVVHSAVNTELFSPSEELDRTSCVEGRSGAPRVLFVGNITGSKGVFGVAAAVAALSDRFPNIALRVIGRAAPDATARLEEIFSRVHGRARLDVRGYVPYEELPDHYRWADFLVAPSTSEPGPGNVYLEAMSCGRPVIAANSGGAPEVVVDGVTGLLVPPADTPALIRAIEHLASDKELAASYAVEARRRVLDLFSEGRYADRIETLYESVLR